MLRLWLGLLVAIIGVTSASAESCLRFHLPTFRQEAKSARVIVYGVIANPRTTGSDDSGRTDFLIEKTLRTVPAMKGKTSFLLPRLIPIAKKNDPPRYVFFCNIVEGEVNAYREVVIRRAESVDYIRKTISLDPKEVVKNVLFHFDYLDDPDPKVAEDALVELLRADVATIALAGKKLDQDKIRKRLRDPNSLQDRIELYVRFLAACGNVKDAATSNP